MHTKRETLVLFALEEEAIKMTVSRDMLKNVANV